MEEGGERNRGENGGPGPHFVAAVLNRVGALRPETGDDRAAHLGRVVAGRREVLCKLPERHFDHALKPGDAPEEELAEGNVIVQPRTA